MVETLVLLVAALLTIAASTVISSKIGVAAPLLLVVLGVGASFLPAFTGFQINPDLVLEGLLPPLLYSSAVSMPAMNFRREFRAISGLSVLLVIGTSLLLGLFFMLVIPEVGFGWGVALGAIISPTDAVATSIVKQTPVSKRVVAILDGESLLNDATALVLLKTAIAATAGAFSLWGAAGTFAYSVVVAVLIGATVGMVNLAIRKRVTDSTVNTVISFTVPFLAAVPAELLDSSGLVAAVCAGLVTGYRAPRMLSPRNRLSDGQNWRTVEFVLEGIVFLTMGLQIKTILQKVEQEHSGIAIAMLIAVGALLITIVARAAYVAPLLASLAARARRYARMQPRYTGLQEKISTPEGRQETLEKIATRRASRAGKTRRVRKKGRIGTKRRSRVEMDFDRFTTRLTRGLADIDYFLRDPLGWREGTVVVWAGMRGAITVAAAQTLPLHETPRRAELVLIAFTVAALSLLVQGGTIGALLKLLSPDDPEADKAQAEFQQSERRRLLDLMRSSAESIPKTELPEDAPREERFAAAKQRRLATLEAQREALLDARDDGTFEADVLAEELVDLDAAQIAIELRGRNSP